MAFWTEKYQFLDKNIIFFIKLTKVLEVAKFGFLANFKFLTLCDHWIPLIWGVCEQDYGQNYNTDLHQMLPVGGSWSGIELIYILDHSQNNQFWMQDFFQRIC